MSPRRAPGSTVAALLVAVAMSLLGFRLYLPGSAVECAAAGGACCCDTGDPAGAETARPEGCGCSISPATPIPVATLAAADTIPAPALAGEASDASSAVAAATAPSGEGPAPRACSSPTQALLKTFRN